MYECTQALMGRILKILDLSEILPVYLVDRLYLPFAVTSDKYWVFGRVLYLENSPWWAAEFGKRAHIIWKNLVRKTVVPSDNDDDAWQMAGEDSLANGFILSLLDTEDTATQEFLQKWVAFPYTFDLLLNVHCTQLSTVGDLAFLPCCCCPYLEQSALTCHVHTLYVCFPSHLEAFLFRHSFSWLLQQLLLCLCSDSCHFRIQIVLLLTYLLSWYWRFCWCYC